MLLNTKAPSKRVGVSVRWPRGICDDGHGHPATWRGAPRSCAVQGTDFTPDFLNSLDQSPGLQGTVPWVGFEMLGRLAPPSPPPLLMV